jgi:hypothetical protein
MILMTSPKRLQLSLFLILVSSGVALAASPKVEEVMRLLETLEAKHQSPEAGQAERKLAEFSKSELAEFFATALVSRSRAVRAYAVDKAPNGEEGKVNLPALIKIAESDPDESIRADAFVRISHIDSDSLLALSRKFKDDPVHDIRASSLKTIAVSAAEEWNAISESRRKSEHLYVRVGISRMFMVQGVLYDEPSAIEALGVDAKWLAKNPIRGRGYRYRHMSEERFNEYTAGRIREMGLEVLNRRGTPAALPALDAAAEAAARRGDTAFQSKCRYAAHTIRLKALDGAAQLDYVTRYLNGSDQGLRMWAALRACFVPGGRQLLKETSENKSHPAAKISKTYYSSWCDTHEAWR